MQKNRSLKQRLIAAILTFVMLVSSLIGTTFAWFTDSVSSEGNTIVAGNLKVDLSHKTDGKWLSLKQNAEHKIFNYERWEPGYTRVESLKVDNLGSLALQYRLSLETVQGTAKLGDNGENLADVIEVYITVGESNETSYDDIKSAWEYKGTLTKVMKDPAQFLSGELLPTGKTLDANAKESTSVGSKIFSIALHMQESAGNEYQNLSVGDIYVNLIATQWSYENDSFGNEYDKDAIFPEINISGITVDVTTQNNVVTEEATVNGIGVTAKIPAGVTVQDGVNKLGLSVTEKAESDANLTLNDGEALRSLDVHMDGVADNNTVPMLITIEKAMKVGLNIGNYTLYHVEDGVSNAMIAVNALSELDAHNEFYYDPATGDVTLAMATFSEVAMVAEQPKWEGNRDYSWYTNAVVTIAEGEPDYVIANADQFAAFGAIVGGMDGQTQNSFAGKYIKLLADINLGDKESENNPDIIFYPIGYYNSEGTYERTNTAITSGLRNFEGTFDGNGHTIANFYQNTWEMKGDHDWYTPEEQYYRDGMGLFGRVYGGTVKNLTVENFSSDGEIATTGVIAAYADGATFENIAIFHCNPRVYNIGNGGIVGCVGWYAKEAGLTTTFTNITVDNSNKISALWGSYDVACGGIVGQYYPTSGQTSANKPANGGVHFENCHVSAQMDVYNDVCANYQYYAYRYTGMLIGSVRENETIDGHVYPKMDGITASGCTVHFGTWNDYYYCEIIDNTTASYTHDYQMSRLTEIKAIDGTTITYLDGTTGTVPASGRANYVIVDYTKGHGTDNATCYHFKDGAVWTHDMGGIQTGVDENGDGQDDLKEDKQHIYLEFNNIVTGYGWGVTSKGLTDFEGVDILDITEGDHEESVNKFINIKENGTDFDTDSTVKVGELFAAIENVGINIKSDNVQVTVSPFGTTSTAGGTYVANTTDWTQGTLTFSGIGQAVITITDYYFCKTATLTVNVVAKDKFDTKFVNYEKYLYRVGNADKSTVALGTIFKALEGANIDSATVAIDFSTVAGNASGTFTANTTDWTKGTIQFTGTGVVKVSIKDATSNTFVLDLEVVDATNLTSATGTTTGGNFVLLCDVNTSTYVNYWNSTLYGNGFTYSLEGAPTAYNSKQGKGILITKNTTLDNLVIVGDEYTDYGAFSNQDFYNTAIDVTGDTTIQNCYISGCSAPVRARNNVTIINSTLYGGAVGNLIIEDGTATLENVTTANYDDGRELVGMGIVIHSDATEAAKLVLNGTLTQYNFISESKVPSDSSAKTLHTAMFSDSCSKYHFGTSPNRYVNTGIISLKAEFNNEDITDNANTGYVGNGVSVSGFDGYVYTQPNTSGSVNNEFHGYKPTTQGAVPPSYSFDYTNKNYVAKTEGSNDYCYAENGKVNISMDDGDTFNWDTSILTIGKGITNYTVSMNGIDYTGKSIAFNTAGDYKVTYTYTDPNNYKLDEDGNITTYAATYTKTVNITVAVVEAATKHAEFTFGSSNTASTTVTVGNNTYVMPNVSGTSSTIGSTTVDGKTIYYPIVEIIMSDGKTSHKSGWYAYFPVFRGAVTITDYADNGTGDKMTPYNESTTTMPGGLSVVGDPKTLFKYQSGSNAGETPVVKNNILVYSSAKIEADRNEYNTVVQYSYTDNAGATYYYYIGYHAPAQTYTSCVTADTLVTLADGTQKRIDQVTANDMLLVWNFYTGDYDAVPAAIIFDHGYGTNTVIKLNFSDGTVVKVVNLHQFFDADLNTFVSIDENSIVNYVGHKFVKMNGDGYETVTLVDYTVTEEYVEAWGIISAEHYNIIVEGMLSTDFMKEDYDLFNYFEFGENMTFDVGKMQADIDTYGLYTYEDFADHLTYEQFVAFNVQYFKIAVEKGTYTYDGILALIETYLNT